MLAYPNPARDRVSFLVDPTASGPVEINIFNLAGERVAVLRAETAAENHGVLTWSAGDVAPGVYLVRVSVGGSTHDLKVAVVK